MENRYLLLCVFLLLCAVSHAQQSTIVGSRIVCPGQLASFKIQNPRVDRNALPRKDDWYAEKLTPLNFRFNFYGNWYDSCLLSTNFYILFGNGSSLDTLKGSFSPFQVAPIDTLPKTLKNAIFPAWQDTDPGNSQTVGFSAFCTKGSFPNREFIFDFCDMPLYKDNNKRFSGQVKLKETSNIIEIHITRKDTVYWQPSLQGIVNSTGQNFCFTPGRNATYWQAYNDAYAFIPTNPACTTYYSSQIPFSPTPIGNGSFEWIFQGMVVGYGDSIQFPINQSGYLYARTIGCLDLPTDSIYVTYDESPKLSTYYNKTKLCLGESFLLSRSDTSYKSMIINWGDGTTDYQNLLRYSKTFSRPGIFPAEILYNSPLGCPMKDSLKLFVTDTPGISINAKDPFCHLDRLLLNVRAKADSVYVDWNDGHFSFQAYPSIYSHQYQHGGSYTISATAIKNQFGYACSSTSSKEIHSIKFSPNAKTSILNTTTSNRGILLYWNTYPDASMYKIYKADAAGYFNYLTTTNDTFFFDLSASNLTINRYKIAVIDPCENEYTLSNQSCNIVLTGDVDEHDYGNLSWNSMDSFPDGIREYVLVRMDTVIQYNSKFSVGLDSSYIDPKLSSSMNRGYLYQVMGISTNGSISYSNTVFLKYAPEIFLPTAFSPDDNGINDKWLPVSALNATYRFEVFNRWGELVFSGDESTAGWDGTFKNQLCEAGQYTVQLRYSLPNLKAGFLKQTITLIR